jgi:hypothetical protein
MHRRDYRGRMTVPSTGGNALSLIKAVIALVADRRTGSLDVRAEGVRTRISFANGKPVFADDEALGETFGRLLMRQGVLTNEQFVRVIDEMTLAAKGDTQLRFGEVAVGLGVLTPAQVERGLADQASGIISRSLQREESQWTFDASPGVAKPPRSFSIEIDPIVFEAVRWLPATTWLDVVGAAPEEPVVLAADAEALAKRFGMTPFDLAFLKTIDGTKTARELLAGDPSPDVNRYAVLATLVLAGAVTPRPRPVAERVREEPKEDRRKADVPGPEASTHAARMAAEQTFQKGLALLHATQAVSAAIELRRAARLQPESLEYLLYAHWAEARIHRDIPSEPDQRTLRELAEKAKKRDPLFAFASYVLGQLAMWAGDDETAKKWFYEALRLDPASEAGQQVRILARRGAGAPTPPGPPPIPKPSSPIPKPTDEPPRREPTTRGAPEPMSMPAPVQTARAPLSPPAPPPPPSTGGWTMRLVFSAAFLAATAYVIFGVARSSVPSAPREPTASPAPTASADAALPVDAERQDTSARPDEAGGRSPASGESEGGKWGRVRLPSRASGHRIFVDGRRFKTEEEGGPLRLPCGPHVVQIGSSGTPESIDLPCGGEVQLQ